MDSTSNEIATEMPQLGIRIYKDGRVERERGTVFVPPSLDPCTGIQSLDAVIDPDTNLSARVFLSSRIVDSPDQKKLPLLIYFHGGGFCIESAFSPTYQAFPNAIAAAGAIIISVNYRLAPENPIPMPYEDSWKAIKWVISHSTENCSDQPWLLKYADFNRIFFAGDSAGANIAHHMAIRVGSEVLNGGRLLGIVLIHPYFLGKHVGRGEPSDENERGLLEKFWMLASPDSIGLDDPYINPALDPKFSSVGCDEVLVCVAEKDRLQPQGWYYYEKLKESGWKGNVEIMEAKGEGHVFHLLNPNTENAVALVKRVGSFMNLEKADI